MSCRGFRIGGLKLTFKIFYLSLSSNASTVDTTAYHIGFLLLGDAQTVVG